MADADLTVNGIDVQSELQHGADGDGIAAEDGRRWHGCVTATFIHSQRWELRRSDECDRYRSGR